MTIHLSPIRLGISACLLGEKVRYDGGHKYDSFLVKTLGAHVEWVPVCPEVETGFPVPREAFRLVGDPEAPRLVTQKTGIDVTGQMETWARGRLDRLAEDSLCGFVFKSKSPSSGMERVKVYNAAGMAEKKGVGIFARRFMERFPLLPVEEEGRLEDAGLREHFIERVFATSRWQEFARRKPTVGQLVAFHAAGKYQWMAHAPDLARKLGALVAAAKGRPLPELLDEYGQLRAAVMNRRATVAKNVNVLQHLAGYFKKQLTAEGRSELAQLIERYQQGWLPLIVPITLIAHYVRLFSVTYLQGQTYLEPHPLELKLRNHA